MSPVTPSDRKKRTSYGEGMSGSLNIHKGGNFDPIATDLKKYSGGEFLVLPSGYFGIGERALALIGWERYMSELALRPTMIAELLDKITDCKVEEAKAKIALGIQIAHHGEDLGIQSTTFFSRKMFREIFKPRLARLFRVYKDAELPMAMHSCGCFSDGGTRSLLGPGQSAVGLRR